MPEIRQRLNITADDPTEMGEGLPEGRFSLAQLITSRLSKLGIIPTSINGVSVDISVHRDRVESVLTSLRRVGLVGSAEK